jgi:hypothetical protein
VCHHVRKQSSKRQAISLATKIAILDRLDVGEGSTLVAKSLGYNEATIRTIHKSKAKIRACVAAGSSKSAKKTCYTRDVILAKMETLLMVMIDDNNAKKIPVDNTIIRAKAIKI